MKETIYNKETSNCLVLISHKMDENSFKYFSFLQKEADGIMDLIILYDCATCEIKERDYPEFAFHFFDSKEIIDFFHGGNKQLPNPLLALLDLIKVKKYDHYLLMESDVVYAGNFRSSLIAVNEVNYDYIHVAKDKLGKAEAHWPINYIHNNPFKTIYFSWCQLFYASYKLLNDINAFIKENNSFYYEFLLPTMAYNKGYSIRQFENFGYDFQLDWGPSEVYEYKYQYERKLNTFYHPIKNLGIIFYD